MILALYVSVVLVCQQRLTNHIAETHHADFELKRVCKRNIKRMHKVYIAQLQSNITKASPLDCRGSFQVYVHPIGQNCI